MAQSSEHAPRPGLLERTSHTVRNLMIGALAVEGIFAAFVAVPAVLVGAEALAAAGADSVYESEKSRSKR